MRKRAWVSWMLIIAMMTALWPAAVGYALERPVVYPERNDGRESEYFGETERVRVYDNGEKKKVQVMTVPVDEVQALVWRPVSGASYYLYSIRDVDNDEPVIVNEQMTNYWINLADMLDWDGPLAYGVTYKIAAAACTSPDDCYWSSEPFYFRLVETVQPEEPVTPEPEPVQFSGAFDQERIELTVGDITRVGGRVNCNGSTLNRVTYQIDGWAGDDGNNRYCSQDVQNVTSVDLSQMSQLVLDTTRAPLNVPGTYTLRLVASVESGEWAHLAEMTVVVNPADEPTHSVTEDSEPQAELSGAFASDYIELNIGDVTTVGGSVNCAGDTLNRVTYQIDGWAGDDGNNRYCSQDVQNVTSVDLSQMSQLVLDTTRAPLNVPGTYTLRLVASVESGEWAHLAEMTVVVNPTDEPTHSVTEDPVTPAPATEAPAPQAELKADIMNSSIAVRLGDTARIEGWVTCKGGQLERVTYLITDHPVEGDPNNRQYSAALGNVSELDLAEADELILDTNRTPLNAPGDYQIEVYAKAVGMEQGVRLANVQVHVYAEESGVTQAPVTAVPVTAVPVTAAPVTAAPVTAAPVTAAPLIQPPVTEAPVTEVELKANVMDNNITVKLGDTARIEGWVTCKGGQLDRVTYLITGHPVEGDPNNRQYSAVLGNVSELDLAETEELILDTNRTPLNVPGTYTLELLAKPVGGEERRLDEVTVHITENGVSNTSYVKRNYDIAFQKSSTKESPMLVLQSVKMAKAAYNKRECEGLFAGLGFENIESYNYNNYSKNTVGMVIGYRDIPDENGTMKRVFAVALRGSNTPDDWLSNFTVGDKDRIYPEGFDVTAKNTWNNIVTYIFKYNTSKYGSTAAEWTDCKVWITGHSRAGAIANLLCGRELFDSGIAFENIYGYTFATPSVVKVNQMKAVAYVYNYINEGDLIPELPLSIWGYRRYGVDRVLADGLNNQGFKRILQEALQSIAPDIETYNLIFKKAVEFGELFRDYMDVDFPECFILGFICAHPVFSGALTATVANGILYLKPGITGSHYLNQLAKQLGIDVDDNMDVQTILDEFAKKLEKLGEAHSYDTYLRSVEAYSNALK